MKEKKMLYIRGKCDKNRSHLLVAALHIRYKYKIIITSQIFRRKQIENNNNNTINSRQQQ